MVRNEKSLGDKFEGGAAEVVFSAAAFFIIILLKVINNRVSFPQFVLWSIPLDHYHYWLEFHFKYGTAALVFILNRHIQLCGADNLRRGHAPVNLLC